MKKHPIILTLIAVKKTQLALKLKKKSVSALVNYAKDVAAEMTTNVAKFPNPNPTLASITSLANQLDAAQKATRDHKSGAKASRDALRKTLELSLDDLGQYVLSIANNDPDNAIAILNMAKMAPKSHTVPQKPDFQIKQGSKPGQLIMMVRAGRGIKTFNFELSTDISNPANWKSMQNHSFAKATVSGLTSGTRYYGRVMRTDNTGTYQVGNVLDIVVS